MKQNYYSAAARTARVTVEVIRAGFRKGIKPTGNVLNAVIVARQLYNGTFRKAAVAAGQALSALQRTSSGVLLFSNKKGGASPETPTFFRDDAYCFVDLFSKCSQF